ncbi:MFS transporter [Cryptosporangium phraense]|uniref:MFS transporter n=1 Tax=Cryptosporangium phraense TaxID=2593070 RepID=UPI00197AEA2D|nr:MFS transporter [Cryptosporangium phraense]
MYRRILGFWLVALALLAFTAAASAPSPLYVVYQARWGFSTPMLTVVFAVYVVALLAALVTVGRLSDYLGRRPVLLAALVVETLGMAVFLTADGLGGLIVARIVQGLATGVATGTISATLVDLLPPGWARLGAMINSVLPMTGLALGALVSGLLVQYAGSPTTVVFAGLTVAFALLAVLVLALPSTISRRPGALAALRPRLGVPRPARAAFLAASPVLVATWAMGGLYLSLGASLTSNVLGVRSHVVAGLVVTVLAGAGALAGIVGSSRDPGRVMTVGAALLALGTVGSLVALLDASAVGFFLGSAVAGAGFGAGFLGAFRSLSSLAPPDERAALFGAIYVVSYVGFSVPAVIAGVLTPRIGLRETAVGYAAVVVALALAVVAASRRPAEGGRSTGARGCPVVVEQGV